MPATSSIHNDQPVSSSPTENRKRTTENHPGQTQSPDSQRTRFRRCTHLRADGKRCADAVYPGHTSLCHHHLSRELRGITDGDSIAADILSSVGNFQSASAINVALGKIFIHQLTGRLSRHDAVALAYQCQLLLQTLPLVKQELKETNFYPYWHQETKRITGVASDLDGLTRRSLLPEANGALHPKDYVSPPDPADADQPIAASPAPPAAPAG